MKTVVRGICLVCVTALASMLFFGVNGNAYVDPSIMTYMIQAAAGLVIAVSAVLGIYFRKLRQRIAKKLHIDENRRKEIESDEIELYPVSECNSETGGV